MDWVDLLLNHISPLNGIAYLASRTISARIKEIDPNAAASVNRFSRVKILRGL